MSVLAALIRGKKSYDTIPNEVVTEINNEVTRSITDNSPSIEAVRAWLYKIEEPEEYHHIVLDKCKADAEAMAYFLKHANGEFEIKDLLDKN